jgi:putative transposase
VRFKASVSGLRQRLEQSLLLFKPDTMLKWHRELVAWKWTFRRKGEVGRPRTTAEVEALVARLAKENAGWGADRIHGEVLKLGFDLSATIVRDILALHSIPPVPERRRLAAAGVT